MRKSKFAKLMLVLTSFLISALVAELIISLFTTHYLGLPKLYQFDPILGYRPIPFNDCKRKSEVKTILFIILQITEVFASPVKIHIK